MNVKVTTLDSL